MQIDETLHKKIVNEATAYLRSYVSERGRNVDLAATAVTDAKAFSEKEALDGKLIDLVAVFARGTASRSSMAAPSRASMDRHAQLALSHPVIVSRDMTSRERFLSRIVQPDVFFILLIVGVLGLYTEFTHPGLVCAGRDRRRSRSCWRFSPCICCP